MYSTALATLRRFSIGFSSENSALILHSDRGSKSELAMPLHPQRQTCYSALCEGRFRTMSANKIKKFNPRDQLISELEAEKGAAD